MTITKWILLFFVGAVIYMLYTKGMRVISGTLLFGSIFYIIGVLIGDLPWGEKGLTGIELIKSHITSWFIMQTLFFVGLVVIFIFLEIKQLVGWE